MRNFNLLHGEEKAVFGDKAYTKQLDKKEARKKGIFYGMKNKRTKAKDLSTKEKKRNKQLSSVRSKVEHPFRILKCQFGFREVMYKGVEKNSLAIKIGNYLKSVNHEKLSFKTKNNIYPKQNGFPVPSIY